MTRYESLTDQEIMRKYTHHNDRAALEFLYKRSIDDVKKVLYTYFGREAVISIDDITQEAMIRSIEFLHGKTNFVLKSWFAYFTRVCINTGINKIRKEKKKSILTFSLSQKNPDIDSSVLSHRAIVQQTSMGEVFIKKFIEELPLGYKIVFKMRFEGYSHPEIAKVLGISEGTSKSQYVRARLSLLSKIARDYPGRVMVTRKRIT